MGASDGTRPVVLVVDDEDLVRTVSRLMLERLGYDVRLAPSGAEAVACLQSGGADPVAAALIDMTMPGMGGLETMRALRAVDPGLPVVLTSGFGEPDAGSAAGPDRPSAFLQKPFQLPALRDILASVARR
jgi:CheY-like chemotaxis protein